jgi:sec-independent protein translocase protein TatA
MLQMIPLFPGLPGGPELLIVLLVLVLLFGANKIPKLARSTGQAMGEFKKGREEVEEELQDMQGGGDRADDPTTARTDDTAATDEAEPATERSAADN